MRERDFVLYCVIDHHLADVMCVCNSESVCAQELLSRFSPETLCDLFDWNINVDSLSQRVAEQHFLFFFQFLPLHIPPAGHLFFDRCIQDEESVCV